MGPYIIRLRAEVRLEKAEYRALPGINELLSAFKRMFWTRFQQPNILGPIMKILLPCNAKKVNRESGSVREDRRLLVTVDPSF